MFCILLTALCNESAYTSCTFFDLLMSSINGSYGINRGTMPLKVHSMNILQLLPPRVKLIIKEGKRALNRVLRPADESSEGKSCAWNSKSDQ